jgi:hypothetical protein
MVVAPAPARAAPPSRSWLLLPLAVLATLLCLLSQASAQCADEATQAASLRRVQAALEDPFGVLQASWVGDIRRRTLAHCMSLTKLLYLPLPATTEATAL